VSISTLERPAEQVIPIEEVVAGSSFGGELWFEDISPAEWVKQLQRIPLSELPLPKSTPSSNSQLAQFARDIAKYLQVCGWAKGKWADENAHTVCIMGAGIGVERGVTPTGIRAFMDGAGSSWAHANPVAAAFGRRFATWLGVDSVTGWNDATPNDTYCSCTACKPGNRIPPPKNRTEAIQAVLAFAAHLDSQAA
jgi:hypothetical protein